MPGWWSRLFGGGSRTDAPQAPSPLNEATANSSRDRAEAALSGTSALPPLLTLDPPPVDPVLVMPEPDDDGQDYGPDPIADYSLMAPVRTPFATAPLREGLRAVDLPARPLFYMATPEGQTTFLSSSEAPETGTALIASWTYTRDPAKAVAASVRTLSNWLTARLEGFVPEPFDPDAYEAGERRAEAILALEPSDLTITAYLEIGAPMDGKLVWDTLHRLGLRWGDMDNFQWPDPTGQTDYLFGAEADDGERGYALPEEIAAGRQEFYGVHFTLDAARTPAPVHVVDQMIRAAEAFAAETGAALAARVDSLPTEGPDALRYAAREMADGLCALGTKPGAGTVCMLR